MHQIPEDRICSKCNSELFDCWLTIKGKNYCSDCWSKMKDPPKMRVLVPEDLDKEKRVNSSRV